MFELEKTETVKELIAITKSDSGRKVFRSRDIIITTNTAISS